MMRKASATVTAARPRVEAARMMKPAIVRLMTRLVGGDPFASGDDTLGA
jgi:hypothetical protein